MPIVSVCRRCRRRGRRLDPRRRGGHGAHRSGHVDRVGDPGLPGSGRAVDPRPRRAAALRHRRLPRRPGDPAAGVAPAGPSTLRGRRGRTAGTRRWSISSGRAGCGRWSRRTSTGCTSWPATPRSGCWSCTAASTASSAWAAGGPGRRRGCWSGWPAGEEDPHCLRCGDLIKTATVSFGQRLDPDLLAAAVAASAEARALRRGGDDAQRAAGRLTRRRGPACGRPDRDRQRRRDRLRRGRRRPPGGAHRRGPPTPRR